MGKLILEAGASGGKLGGGTADNKATASINGGNVIMEAGMSGGVVQDKKIIFEAQKPLFEAAKELGVSILPKYETGSALMQTAMGNPTTPAKVFKESTSGNNLTKYLQSEIQNKIKENEAYHQEIINFDSVAAEKEIAELEKRLANMPTANWDTRGNMGQAQAQKNADAVNEIKAQIAEKKIALTQKKRLQELLKSNDTAVNDPDFDKYVKNGKEISWQDVGKVAGVSGGTMTQNQYDDLGAAAWALYKRNNPDAKAPMYTDLRKADIFIEQMTDDEFDLLAYYIGKDKETVGNQAETYVELMKETLQTRKGQEIYEQYLKDNTVLEVLYGIPAGLDQFANGVTSLFNFKDDYIPASPVQVAGSLAREDLADDSIPLWYNFNDGKWENKIFGASLGQMAYDSVQTTANMAPSIAASTLIGLINPTAGAVTGGVLMGGSAAGNAYQEALNNGWGKGEARTYSLLIGASEAVLSATISKVFGGKLVSDAVENAIKGVTNGFARFSLNYGAAFVSEGFEEAAQEVLSPIFENIAFGYNRKGFEDIDWGEVAYSFLLGGLSGGMFETAGSGVKRISSVASVMKEYNTPEKTQNLLKLALSFPAESKANKLATKYNEQVKSNRKLSANKVYNLAVATENVLTERLTKLGETKNAPVIASAALKTVTTGQLTAKERLVLSSSQHGAELLNEINVTEEAETTVLQSSANGDNSGLQSTAEGGIISQGGEENGRTLNQRTVYGGVEENAGTGNKSEIRQSGATVDEYVAGGKAEILSRASSDGQRVVRVNYGNSNVTFTEGRLEDTKGYKVYNAFRNAGMKVIYCEGAIERTVNGKVISRTEAFTAPDGTVYVSSESKLPPKQTFNHEKVHVADKTNNPAYAEYEAVLCDEVDYFSEVFQKIAEDINKFQFDNKYDIDDISSYPIFMREIVAYINQFVLSDPTYAQNTFGGMFGDWNAVVEAVNKFNTDMKADFTESASFMPENNSSDNDSREPGFREADTKEIYRKSTEKDFDILTGKRKNAAQRQMEAVAEKFGVKVGYKDDITKGYYDPELKTIYMNPVWSLTEQYFVLFKHELTHHLENYKAYDSFKFYVVNFSNSFDAYVRDRLKDELGEEFKGSRKEALKAYNDIVLKQRQASKEIPDRIKKSYNPESIEREIVADFVGEVMLGGKDAAKAEAALMEIAKTEHRTVLEKIRDWVNEWVSIIKGEPQNRTLAEDLEYLNRRIARVLDSKEIKKSTTQSGVVKFDIAVLENGNTYVKASRNIIKGKTLSEQRNDITNFFKKLLKNKPSIDIHTIEGDILTLTMDETADKARDNYEVVKGQRIKMSEDEFAVKLRVESHIDEIVETSIKSNKPLSRDAKVHDFAKDGFEYRTAYFEDFDGEYYKIRFSIGHNGTVATVYNVGKIKEDVPSSAKLIAVVGSQALDGTSSNDIILNEEDSVKNNISREGEKYSSDNANSKHSIASEAFSKKLAELTEDVKSGKIGFDEFAKQVNDLAMNEHRIGEELMHALTEQEKLAKDFQEGAKRAEKLRDKIIMRQNKELMRSRRELKQEVESEREMYADRLTNLDCIRRSIKRIDSKLRANTNDKHVPEHLKMLANEVVSLFVANDTTPFKRSQLEKIKAFYDRGLNSKKADDAFIAAYDPEISENFEKLSELIEGKKLRDLDWLESTRVRTLVEHVEYLINSGNETFVAGKKVETDEIGLSAIHRLLGQNTKVRIIGTQQIEAGIKYANMTPIYFFDRVGGVLKELFNDIVAGQDKWYRNVEMGKAYIRNIKEKYRYSEWKDKTIEFNTEDGESIELTVEQAMLLYATAQREYRDKTKQTNHLLKGGIVIEAQPLSIKAITTKLKDGKGKDAFLEEVNSRAHRITEGDIKKVFDLLSDEQIAYADALVEYLSNDMAALGNEVSMKLHGIRKYTSEYYIPYNSAANFLNMQMGVTNDARLKHQSFTKAVSEGAVTPLVLSNITEVCADHINRMSMYHALTIPLDAMERVLNYQIPGKENDGTESGAAGKSVASEITRIYGESAANYLKTFINDMNGTVRRSGDETIMNSMISKFKKSAVLASASVTIQQPSAVMRSMAYIDPKYFIKTTLKIAERDYQQLMQYAPGVAGIKAMGRFDTGTGVSTVKWMLQEEPKGLSQKAKAFVDLKDSTYRDDILSWTAAKADEITWAHIWAAVKAEVADKTTLKPGTDEFFKACGRRFTQVINYTQVYDSTLSRSQIMRNKSTAATMMTAFMSEPTVSLNLLMDAVYQAQKGTKASKKFAARAVGAFVGNVLLNAALKSLVTAARDDDEDETYLEKYISAFTGNFTDDIFLLNSIPYVKDIYSSFKGYTVERADMSLFSDLAEAVRMLSNDNKTPLEKIEKIAGALAAFLGLPVKNVIRDMKAAWNVIDMAFISKPKGDLQGAIFDVTGIEGGERYEALAEAAEKGNDAEYQRIYKHLIDSGLSDEDIKTNVQMFYRKDQGIIKQTKTYMKELADNKTYQGFDNETKKKIKSDITTILAKEKTVEALAREPDRFDKLYEAKRKSKAQYEKLKKEMLDEGMSESLIKSGEEIAKVAYMKSIGIDIKEYYLFKMAMSEKYADTDSSGGVSSKEKQEAAKKLDMDAKAKQWLMKN